MKNTNHTFISSFRIGNDVFTHVINTFTDETHCINRDGDVIFTVSSFADLFDGNGNKIGKFYLTSKNDFATQYDWGFVDGNGVETENPLKNKTDLIEFELEIFKSMLKNS